MVTKQQCTCCGEVKKCARIECTDKVRFTEDSGPSNRFVYTCPQCLVDGKSVDEHRDPGLFGIYRSNLGKYIDRLDREVNSFGEGGDGA